MSLLPFAPLTPELAAANREARRRILRRVVVTDARRTHGRRR